MTGYRLDNFDFNETETFRMGKLNIGVGTPIEEIPAATRGISSEDSLAILAMVATSEQDPTHPEDPEALIWTPTGTATEYDDAGNRMTYSWSVGGTSFATRAEAETYALENDYDDDDVLSPEETANKAGRVFKRALANVEPDGFSAKLRVYQRRGDAAWVFDVMLVPAREGKGEPKATVKADGTPAKAPGRPKRVIDAVDSATDD